MPVLIPPSIRHRRRVAGWQGRCAPAESGPGSGADQPSDQPSGGAQQAVAVGELAQLTLALAGEFLHHVRVHGPHLVISVARSRSSLRTGSATDATSRRLPRASSESAFAGGIFRGGPL